MELLPSLYYYHKQHCEHNNISIYISILMKLCMQVYIHKISDEFENQIDSIISDVTIALCCIIVISNLVKMVTLINIGNCNFHELLYAGIN